MVYVRTEVSSARRHGRMSAIFSLRRFKSWQDSAKQFVDNGNALLTDVRAGKGTLGKLATDDSLYTQYRQVGENLSSATAKMNANETTIGKFFTDPKLYDNLAGLTGDMRLLIGGLPKPPA